MVIALAIGLLFWSCAATATLLEPPYKAEWKGSVAARQYWIVDPQTILVLHSAPSVKSAYFALRSLPTLKPIAEWNVAAVVLKTLPLERQRFGLLLYQSQQQSVIFQQVRTDGTVEASYRVCDSISNVSPAEVDVAVNRRAVYVVLNSTFYAIDRQTQQCRHRTLPAQSKARLFADSTGVWIVVATPAVSHLLRWEQQQFVRQTVVPTGNPVALYRDNDRLVLLHHFGFYSVLTLFDPRTLEIQSTNVVPYESCAMAVAQQAGRILVATVERSDQTVVLKLGRLARHHIVWETRTLPEELSDVQRVVRGGASMLLLAGTHRLVGVDWDGTLLFSIAVSGAMSQCAVIQADVELPNVLVLQKRYRNLESYQLQHQPLWSRIAWQRNLPYGIGLLTIAVVAWMAYRLFRYRRLIYTLFGLPTADALCVLNNRLRIVQMNHVARQLLGILPELQSRPITDLKQHSPVLTKLYSVVQRVQQQQVRESTVVVLEQSAGGQREWLFHVVPLRGALGQRRGILVMGRDVTDLMHHQRLVNWAQLMHDMKTNLSIIRLNADLIAQLGGSSVQKAVQKIVRQVSIMQGRAVDVIELARGSQSKRQDFDVADLCRNVARELEDCHHLHPGAELHLDLTPCPMVGYPRILERAIRNAVENGLRALEQQAGEVRIRCRCDRYVVMIAIQDNGIGMDEQKLNEFLQPYKSSFERGTGLGTMVMQEAVRKHRGRIRVESRLGVGTTVFFYLPKRPEYHSKIIPNYRETGSPDAGIEQFNGQTAIVNPTPTSNFGY